MQQEKQNNQWAEPVGSLQELPDGFQFNSQKVWNELEQQLPVPSKKSWTVYYAAASVLVIALSALFFLQPSQPERSIIVAAQPAAQPLKSAIKIEQQEAVAQKTIPVKKSDNIAAVKHKAVSVSKDEAAIVTIPAETKELAAEIDMQLPANPLVLEKKALPKKNPTPVIAKTGPKLKIIYLNELGVMPPPEPLNKQELKQMVQQQQSEQQETAPAKENLKQVLYFKTIPRTTTSTSINNQ